MIFNFGKRKTTSKAAELYPDTAIIHAEPAKAEGRDYRKFVSNQQAVKLLTGNYISFVDGSEGNSTSVFLVNHNSKEFTVSYDGTNFKLPCYEVSKARTFNCKELSLLLEKTGVITAEDRDIRLSSIAPFSWVPEGATIYQMERFTPKMEDTLSPAQRELANVKVTTT